MNQCKKCGHAPGYHTTTQCVYPAGSTVKVNCDCTGWERDASLDPKPFQHPKLGVMCLKGCGDKDCGCREGK